MARLTTVGASLIANAVGAGPKLQITKFVFANIPGLSHTTPEPANEPMPAPGHIVFQRAPTKEGIIDENRVAYSQMMMTDVGDFEFNWVGLVYTDPVAGDKLVMFAYVPPTLKIKTAGATVGNVLTRNMVIEHLGIANAVPVVVSAESWMFDFMSEINELNADIEQLKSDVEDLQETIPEIGVTTFELTATTSVARVAKLTLINVTTAANATVTLNSATFRAGDVVEINKGINDGQLDIRVTIGSIYMPDNTVDNTPWFNAGSTGSAMMRFDGTNWRVFL